VISFPGISGVKAVLFDLDGSLVDSMWMWRSIDEEYLGRFGISAPSDLTEGIGGRSIYETALYFRERFGITDNPEKMMTDWNEMAGYKYINEVPLKPGASEFLGCCKDQKILLGVATSNSRDLTEKVLSSHGIRGCFDVIMTGNDVKKGKPAPDIYKASADSISVASEACVVFEDVPDGIKAAKAAGMYVGAVEDDFSAPFEKEKRKLSDFWIKDYRELINK